MSKQYPRVIQPTAVLVGDLISAEDYDILTRPWRTVIGPIHPDDEEVQP